jgi:hypothetical protein
MHTVGHLHMHNYIMNDVLPVYEVRRFKTCRNVTVLIELHMCKWLIVCILFVICSSDWPNFLQPSHVTDTFHSTQLLQHPLEPDSVTLKMQTVCFLENLNIQQLHAETQKKTTIVSFSKVTLFCYWNCHSLTVQNLHLYARF